MLKTLSILTASFLLISAQAESETAKGFKKDVESFKVEMEQKLETIETRLAELKRQAHQKGSEQQEQLVREYEEARNKMRRQIDHLSDEGRQNWTKLKNRLARSADDLNKKIQEALE